MDDSDYNEDTGFLGRHRILVGVVVGAVVLGALATGIVFLMSQKSAPHHKQQEVEVRLIPPPPMPPPPPPPPPPPTPPPPEQKMIEQPPVDKPEQKPDDKPKDKEPDKPPGPPGPAATGPADAFGFGGGGGGGYSIGGGGGGSRWGWYAGEVQSRIADALRQNKKTRVASADLKVRLWVDGTGRIARVELSGSSGDPDVDNAIKNEVLTGLQLSEAPPKDMPMPIVLRINAKRPN